MCNSSHLPSLRPGRGGGRGVGRRGDSAIRCAPSRGNRRRVAKKECEERFTSLRCGRGEGKGGWRDAGGRRGGSPGETRKVLYRMFECVEMYIKVVRNGHPQGQTPRPGGWLREGRGEEAFSLSLEK